MLQSQSTQMIILVLSNELVGLDPKPKQQNTSGGGIQLKDNIATKYNVRLQLCGVCRNLVVTPTTCNLSPIPISQTIQCICTYVLLWPERVMTGFLWFDGWVRFRPTVS